MLSANTRALLTHNPTWPNAGTSQYESPVQGNVQEQLLLSRSGKSLWRLWSMSSRIWPSLAECSLSLHYPTQQPPMLSFSPGQVLVGTVNLVQVWTTKSTKPSCHKDFIQCRLKASVLDKIAVWAPGSESHNAKPPPARAPKAPTWHWRVRLGCHWAQDPQVCRR